MLSRILPCMRCPVCLGSGLRSETGGVRCSSCGKLHPIREGILDMLGDDPGEVITPFQRLMQTPAVASVYEKVWRRIGYFLASSRSFEEEMRTVLRMGEGRAAERVLDLACGTGIFTRPLARRGFETVVGLDLSWPMLKQARRLMMRDGIRNMLLVRATAFGLPFADASFDYVNCCGALHLFDRPDRALEEIGRVLAREGLLCVQTTIRPSRSAGMAFFLERFIRFGFFTEEKLVGMLSSRGFSIVQSERHRISYTFAAKHAGRGEARPGPV